MRKDNFKTVVIFRKFKDEQIIALFPYSYYYIPGRSDTCESYMHMGQHSDAKYSACISVTKPASRKEYKDLFKELKSIGYNLQVMKRRQTK